MGKLIHSFNGQGCKIDSAVCGMPEHNPKPSTARGKRRHNARSEEAKNHAVKAWDTGRSIRPSKKQLELEGGR